VRQNNNFLAKGWSSMKGPSGRSIKTNRPARAPRITTNNKIQFKFATKEFVGEYFHYTGDLFLIYTSGKLARLNCSRA
jgi:hypothetical protein